MDDIIQYNKKRWEQLAGANVLYSRPALDLDPRSARELLDPYHIMGDVRDKEVLCLASGGGQQSVAFALLGARVTVYDLSETQLERDRTAAAHYGLAVKIVQGDMQDLSAFAGRSFDLVWQPYSINFVPNARRIFGEVARVLRPGGLYRLDFANPFTTGIDEREWNGAAYPLNLPYVDGAEIIFNDPDWEIWDDAGNCARVPGPREFRHTLSTVVNGLVELGFILLGLWEWMGQEAGGAPGEQAEPGTWEHFIQVAPPWFHMWLAYRPDFLGKHGA
jgi:SAM-dependent methyltransferase